MVSGFTRVGLSSGGEGSLQGPGVAGELAGEGDDVEDEGDPAVAEDGGAGEAADPAVVGLEALDHHLLLAEQLVDQEAERLAVGLDDDHQLTGAVGLGLDAELAG